MQVKVFPRAKYEERGRKVKVITGIIHKIDGKCQKRLRTGILKNKTVTNWILKIRMDTNWKVQNLMGTNWKIPLINKKEQIQNEGKLSSAEAKQ